MARLLVTDELWAVVKPILPKWTPSPKGGQPRKSDRLCLTGILFVLKTGIPWEDFPQEMGCSGMTLWNRLDEWRRAGVLEKLHRVLLERLRGEDAIDFSRVIVDSASVRAVHGGKNGPQPCGPGQKGLQAPSHRRRQWHSAGRDPHRGQPSRRDPVAPARRGDPAPAGQAGQTLEQTQGSHGGPRVRQRSASRGTDGSGDRRSPDPA